MAGSMDHWRSQLIRSLASRYEIDKVWNRCGSPIEAVMLFAIVVVAREEGSFVVLHNDEKRVSGEAPADVVDCLSLEPQAQLGSHRVDLLVSLRARAVNAQLPSVAHMVVECDGHAFHEKTREQVSRDNQRDRDLQEMGFRVFRFSGSELNADPLTQADRVLRALRSEVAEAID